MSTNNNGFAKTQHGGSCTDPQVGEGLSAYITDPLEEGAEDVEDHLLNCRPCREFYLTMLDILDEARAKNGARGGSNNGHTPDEEATPSLADFRKSWP